MVALHTHTLFPTVSMPASLPPLPRSYIFCSILHCDKHPEVPLMNIKHSTEQFLAASGLNYTIFRLCGFMQASRCTVCLGGMAAVGAGCSAGAANCKDAADFVVERNCVPSSPPAAVNVLATLTNPPCRCAPPPHPLPACRPSSETMLCPSWKRSRCGAPPTRRAPRTWTRRWGAAGAASTSCAEGRAAGGNRPCILAQPG